MFRYIGLAWDDSQDEASATSLALGRQIRGRPDWDVALQTHGLQVFVTGSRSRANGTCVLPDGRGVVLGKLFRRHRADSPSEEISAIPDAVGEQIRQSAGRTLVHDFWGRYIAFFLDMTGSPCVLRDPTATLPCFVLRHQGVAIVFSWLEDILQLLDGVVALHADLEAVRAFLTWGALGGQQTALPGVTQVLAGEVVDLRQPRSVLLWSAVAIAAEPLELHEADAEERLRETVRSTARAWASCHDTILLRLSGGVDSSILLSCLASGDTSADVVCVNYHSAGSDSDERGYARLAATRAGRDLIERERDALFSLEQLRGMAHTPVPINHVGWMNSRADARLASAHAASALFTGAGGDSLFFEFPRAWPAADYLQLKGWDVGFAAALLDAAELGRVSVWGALALAVKERLRRSGARDDLGGTPVSFLAESAQLPAGLRGRYIHPDLRRTALPVGKHVQAASLMYPLGYYDPFETNGAPEVVNPLLSQPLVELCLRLPTYLLTRGGRGRALARRAFAADLPGEIAFRRSKGGMEEHVKNVLSRNLDLVRGMLLEGELARQGLIDRVRLEEALSGGPTPYPGAPGQIHALLAAEVWLGRWRR